MKKFEELSKEKNSLVESKTSEYWQDIDVLKESIDKRDNYFVFYDGPATANGMPGIHHMLAKFLKDTFCKYKTMQGYKVIRKVGWDTHGLPVELEVEKQLGFTSKLDIEKYGLKEFNEKCRESVWKNEKAFSDLTVKMGQFIDLKHPYVTYDNNYIETEWWILKQFFDKGLIYEGHKIIPFCTRCGTGLASHEVAQGYKEISVNSVVVPMKMVDEDCYFLVWTTTPWTLLANVALCVNPSEEYVKVNSMGYKFILASKLAHSILGDEFEVLETYQGKDLEYKKYEQLLPFIKVTKEAFYVTMDNYVTMEDGTGIVHIAPAFGEDDYNVGKRYGLPVVNPVGEDGKYKEGPWQGMFVMDADLEVIKWLKENDKLFKKIKMEHNYPHCWRCGTPLLYYSKPSWYIKTTAFKDDIIRENNKINWYPKFVGEKRFSNWLENINDWAISRSRYWGTPIPLWKCVCGHLEMIGSREELVKRVEEKLDQTIELHRPYVDELHIKCPDCGKLMNRIPEVMDCWFDSGSMPFAQYHYPFENKELFDTQFPADFICEGIDQTRGWFYVLLVISTFVMGKSPYKNVLVNDLLLDKYGKKMSKSKGNAINPFDLIDEYGADTIRWYFPYVSPVWTPTKFDIDGLKEVYSKFFSTLKNTYNFFAIYANTDEVDPREFNIPVESRPEIDKWMLSKYNRVLKSVTASYEEYDLTNVVRVLTEFVSEDLSNWYIRRNRRRFWASDLDDDKKAVYNTTYEVLLGLVKIIAPIVPFISEDIYRKLTDKKSVHLEDFPKYDESLINDNIETRMDLVRSLISIGRYVREENKIKVRQPLSEALIDEKDKLVINDLLPLIAEELNVKTIHYTSDLGKYMNFLVKPNFKVAGPIFGANIKYFAGSLINLDLESINKLKNNEVVDMMVNNESYSISGDMVDIRISSKEGFNAGMENNNFIILNTELTKDLIDEGIARELVSKVQQLRKNNDFEMLDRITIYYHGDDEVKEAIKIHEDYIKKETLATNIVEANDELEIYDLNGHNVGLKTEKN